MSEGRVVPQRLHRIFGRVDAQFARRRFESLDRRRGNDREAPRHHAELNVGQSQLSKVFENGDYTQLRKLLLHALGARKILVADVVREYEQAKAPIHAPAFELDDIADTLEFAGTRSQQAIVVRRASQQNEAPFYGAAGIQFALQLFEDGFVRLERVAI